MKECPDCKGKGWKVNGYRDDMQSIKRSNCPTCSGTGKQPEEKLNIFNLKDRQVDLYDIDPDIAEITPTIVDELLFGKQPDAAMEYECLSCPNMITDGEYCSECSDTKDGRPQKKDVIYLCRICATCDFCKSEKNEDFNGAYWYEYNCNKHDFHIAQDLTVHRCDRWKLRK